MAVLTAQGIADLSVELLVRTLVLPRTVERVPGNNFAGANGDTITVRVRQPRSAKTQATPGATITIDAIDETAVDLTVAHLYDATPVTDEDLTLNIESFASQVVRPMMEGVAIGAEDQVAAPMNAVPATILSVTASNVEDSVLQARTTLGRNDVPMGGRWLACSPEFAELILGIQNLEDKAASGSSSALRDAVIGRYRGFDVVESAGLTAGEAVAYHASAFVWGNRAPAIPSGANSAAVSTSSGVALRSIQDFDPTTLRDIVAVSTFAGASEVLEDGTGGIDRKRCVKLTTATA